MTAGSATDRDGGERTSDRPDASTHDASTHDASATLDGFGRIDRELHDAGFEVVAGVDESGRGAWAGPLIAAAVAFPAGVWPEGLRDSKTLTPLQRERLYPEIRELALGIAVVRVTPARIDREGLHAANRWALAEAVRRLDGIADFVVTDGFGVEIGDVPHLAVRKGDRLAAAVAAAGVIAKVVRDRAMRRYDKRYPGYGFAEHKGYGTPRHREALARLGPSPIHRRSFAGVGDVEPVDSDEVGLVDKGRR